MKRRQQHASPRPALWLPAPTGFLLFAGILAVVSLSPLTPVASGQCQIQKILDPNGQTGDGLGSSVAQRNKLLVIGSPSAQGTGAALVYRHDGLAWVFEQELTSSDGQSGDQFGASVATANGRITVGARKHGQLGVNSGAAYIFEFDGTQWNETQKLLAPDGEQSDHFGHAVAMTGGRAFVSAYLDDDGFRNAGAVHVFERSGGGWSHADKIPSPAPQATGQFGFSVAASKSVLVVGSKPSGIGDAHVFRRVQGQWTGEGTLQGAAALPGDQFGFSVDVDDDLALVGAPNTPGGGAAHLYRHDGTTWSPEATLAPSGLADGDRFGHSVAVRPNRVAVSAVQDDTSTLITGSVYTFLSGGGSWLEESKIAAEDVAARDRFGIAVALDQGLLFAGSRGHDATDTDAGAAYVFMLSQRQAAWSNYGAGWPGAAGIPGLTSDAPPILGTTITLTMENSAQQATRAALLIGVSEDSQVTPLGGTVLVDWYIVRGVRFPDANPVTIPWTISCTSLFLGEGVYAQGLILDLAASHGLAFTPGLRLDFGL